MDPTEILLAVGAATDGPGRYSAVVDLTEHQSNVFDLPMGLSALEIADLYAVLNARPLQGLLKASVVHRGDGRLQLQIATDCHVGFGSVQHGTDRVFVRVRPKIDTRRFLELASIAGALPKFDLHTEVSVADFADVLRWMLELFVRSMEDMLAKGGLRPTHERVDRVLRNRVRGKLLIPPFMTSLAKGRPDRIPCQFSALVFDNAANRILKWALAAVAKMSRDLDDAGLDARVTSLERQFGEVALVRPSRATLERTLVLPPNQRHYGDVVPIAKMLLLGFHVESSPGAVPSISLSTNMYDIYERAFWALFKEREITAQAKPAWKLDFAAVDGASMLSVRFTPDIYVRSSTNRAALIIDTKWKSAVRPYQTESLVKPSTSDIYQVATYAGTVLRDQAEAKRCLAVLMYPSLVDCSTLMHRIDIGSFETVVVLMGWNVTRSPSESVNEAWAYLDALRSHDLTDGALETNAASDQHTLDSSAP